jgi:hypothetical protein
MTHIAKRTTKTPDGLGEEVITEKLNQIYEVQKSGLHPADARYQYERLSRELWDERVYHHLVVEASSSGTEIWLADDDGHLVQTGTGTLDAYLVAGDYVVQFDLGTTAYPIRLTADSRQTEQDIRT